MEEFAALPAIKDPFEKLHFCKKFDLHKDEHHQNFLDAYRQCRRRGMVWVENFREDTKQWRMVYDPYLNKKML